MRKIKLSRMLAVATLALGGILILFVSIHLSCFKWSNCLTSELVLCSIVFCGWIAKHLLTDPLEREAISYGWFGALIGGYIGVLVGVYCTVHTGQVSILIARITGLENVFFSVIYLMPLGFGAGAGVYLCVKALNSAPSSNGG
jgi:hypothetical protein